MKKTVLVSLAIAFGASANAQPFEPTQATAILSFDDSGCPDGWSLGPAIYVLAEAPDGATPTDYVQFGDETLGLVNLQLFTCYLRED